MENSWPGITTLNQAERGRAAQAYAAGGLPVFPVFWVEPGQDNRLRCACGDIECDRPGKHPLARWKSEATTDPDIVHDWWGRWPQANIGIPTGPTSNLLVLDLDRRSIPTLGEVDGRDELERWCEDNHVTWPLPTLEQRTGGGGGQLVFRHVEGARTLTAWLPGVDVRAEGGYILAPPSGHVSGGAYTWLNERGPLEAPERLAAVLRVARGHATATTSSGQAVDYDYGLAKLEGPPPGARDHFFNAYAFELRSNGVDRAEAEHRITELWERCDHEAGGGFALAIALEKVARVWHDVPAGEARGSVTVDEINIARQLAERAALGNGNGHVHREDGSGEGVVVQGPWQGGGGPLPPWVSNEPPLEDLTDTGNAHRLQRLLGDQLRFMHNIGWYHYTGARWSPERVGEVDFLARQVAIEMMQEAPRHGDEAAQRRVIEWARQTKMQARHQAMLSMAQALPGIATETEQFDALDYLLNIPKGEVDLRTRTPEGEWVIGPHNREHLLTRCTAVDPAPPGSSPLLEEFWLTFMPPDPNRTNAHGFPDPWQDRNYLMEMLGSCLWAGNRHRAFFILHGPTTTGKSTLASLLARAVGDYHAIVNMSVFRGSFDDRPRPDLLDTRGARFIVGHEASERWEMHGDEIKKQTGGEMVKARQMHSKIMVTWKPTATPLVVANHAPRIQGADDAVKVRLMALPLVRQPRGPVDLKHKEKLLADEGAARAFLGELIEGCLRRGDRDLRDGIPELFSNGTMTVFEELDDVKEILDSLQELGLLRHTEGLPAYACASTMDIYRVYDGWLRDYGSIEQRKSRLGPKQLSRRLMSMRGWELDRSNGSRWLGWQTAMQFTMEDR